jgi:hypothetical protein
MSLGDIDIIDRHRPFTGVLFLIGTGGRGPAVTISSLLMPRSREVESIEVGTVNPTSIVLDRSPVSSPAAVGRVEILQ